MTRGDACARLARTACVPSRLTRQRTGDEGGAGGAVIAVAGTA